MDFLRYLQVTWIEHNEVDYSYVPTMFRELVSSGFAFRAKHWIATLNRQCERLKLLMEDNSDGRKRLLQLSQRISRSYNEAVRGSTENHWQPLPTTNGENILVKTSFNVDNPGHPHGVIITVATSLKLPVPLIDVFKFPNYGSNRSKWDILSHECATQDLAYFATGREASSRVSLVAVELFEFPCFELLI
ncbi:homeobox-leucine zipper protein ROC1-like isoform X1 [Apium graveolens]|uniref:homeobox-leucine zipper protein ROC1-like isoform X1 n=1 Tax=Apium graveolens TaxID=4045 RepID=UPI003D78C3D0